MVLVEVTKAIMAEEAWVRQLGWHTRVKYIWTRHVGVDVDARAFMAEVKSC